MTTLLTASRTTPPLPTGQIFYQSGMTGMQPIAATLFLNHSFHHPHHHHLHHHSH